MFIGHYAAAFAAKAVRPVLPLWLLFVAVQLVDFGWAVLVMLGVEKVRIIPGFTEASPLDLYYMPFTHSLVAGVIWSIAFGALYFAVKRGAGRLTSAFILALAVFSHWIADLIVHMPDLPIVHGDPKFGFGLWQNFWASQLLEAGLVLAALVWYVSVTKPKGRWGVIAPWLLVAVMLAVQAYTHVPAEVPTPGAFAAQGLAVFSLYALLAWAMERTREPKGIKHDDTQS